MINTLNSVDKFRGSNVLEKKIEWRLVFTTQDVVSKIRGGQALLRLRTPAAARGRIHQTGKLTNKFRVSRLQELPPHLRMDRPCCVNFVSKSFTVSYYVTKCALDCLLQCDSLYPSQSPSCALATPTRSGMQSTSAPRCDLVLPV